MARMARVVIPGVVHHVTQRGNRRQDVFFSDDDYSDYLTLLGEWCGHGGVSILSYCLMPNHVHLLLVPSTEDSLARAVGEAHRRYTCGINLREGWRGHLWQGRFASFPLSEQHLFNALNYIEENPVRAGLVEYPGQWQWSSARGRLHGRADTLVDPQRLAQYGLYAAAADKPIEPEVFRRHERTGRPLGDEFFIRKLEQMTQRTLTPAKPGPKPSKGTL
jgi:Transposase and inactivated derivatives